MVLRGQARRATRKAVKPYSPRCRGLDRLHPKLYHEKEGLSKSADIDNLAEKFYAGGVVDLNLKGKSVWGLCPFCSDSIPVRRFASNRPYAKAFCKKCGIRFEITTEDNLPKFLPNGDIPFPPTPPTDGPSSKKPDNATPKETATITDFPSWEYGGRHG